jgi:hypothetical protein
LLLWINKCTLTSFVALGVRPKGKAQKYGEPTVSLFCTTMLQHIGRFWSRIS